MLRSLLLLLCLAAVPAPLWAQGFVDDFSGAGMGSDPSARLGWATLAGDGEATVAFRQEGGHGVIDVDARQDRRGIWWALIKRSISAQIDGRALARPDRELRIEARVRSPSAPRRLNMSVNHTRTTDFHDNLAEFDLPDTGWHNISFTTQGFDAAPADEVFVQIALIDWGIDRFRLEIDHIRVDVVDPRRAGPDLGEPLAYRPAIPPSSSFDQLVPVTEDAIVDTAYPWVNFRSWTRMGGGDGRPLLATSGTQTMLLRFDLSAQRGRSPDGWGVLELTTDAVQWAATGEEEFGYLRVAEVLDGDPDWVRASVTHDSFLAGKPRSVVIGQMMIDVPPSFAPGSKTRIAVSPPVLRRLISGRSKGLAIYAQGAVAASFHSSQASVPDRRPTLRFRAK